MEKKELNAFLKRLQKHDNPTGKKCPVCGSKNMYYDNLAGPIVGGFIVDHVRSDGTVGPSQGAHHTGSWVCYNCIKLQQEDYDKWLQMNKKSKKMRCINDI